MRAHAEAHPRWGYRTVHALLVDEGWVVNRKRIERLWRAEGLQVPPSKGRHGQKALGADSNAAWNLPALHPNHVWGYDFVAARTDDGGPQPFGYTGAYTNPTTGLVHFGARYYDPTLGRFTQPDPQTHPGDITQSSPYPYAGNDPTNHTDPSGAGFLDKLAGGITGSSHCPTSRPRLATGELKSIA